MSKFKIETVGQKTATGLLNTYGQRVLDTGHAGKPRLILGPAGVGKSHITEAFVTELETQLNAQGRDCTVLRVESASEFSRADAPASLELKEALKNSCLGIFSIIFVDEAHSLPLAPFAPSPSPMQRVFNTLLYGSGQGWERSGHVEFKGEAVSFDSRNLCFVFLTNHPEKMGGGRNSDAIRRRMQEVTLELYTAKEMNQVLPAYFEKKGRMVAPDAMKEISKFHRGTLAAVDHILELLPAFGEITLADVQEVLPVSKYKLRGFLALELQAMKWLRETTEPKKRQNLALRFKGLDISEMYRHAISQCTPSKAGLIASPFMTINNSQEYLIIDDIWDVWVRKNSAALAHVFDKNV